MDERFFNKRRHNPRIKRTFYISYYDKNDPTALQEISQIKDISVGGMCFTAPHRYAPLTKLKIEIKIPYLEKSIQLDGSVKTVFEKIPNFVNETHVEFDKPSPEIKSILEKVVRDFVQEESIPERRKYVRIAKNFIVKYYDKANPTVKYEITQIKNISRGGMCLITSHRFDPSTKLMIELRTPHFTDLTVLEGTVLESHEMVANIIYETRLKFDALTQQAEFLLEKMIEFLQKESALNKRE